MKAHDRARQARICAVSGSYDGRVERANRFLRAVLPPIAVSAARRLRRRVRLMGTASSPRDPSLSDGVVELRPIDRRDLETIKRAAHDPEIRLRFALLKARPTEYFD